MKCVPYALSVFARLMTAFEDKRPWWNHARDWTGVISHCIMKSFETAVWGKFYPSFPRGLENSRSDKAIVNSCLVPRPHYFTRPKCFGSRCPSDREGLGKRRTGTTQSQGETIERSTIVLQCSLMQDQPIFVCIYLYDKFKVKMDNTFFWKHVNIRITNSLYNY